MFLNFDLSGAEWVVVAYITRDPNMLGVVQSKKSPHIVTGALISNLSEELVYKEFKAVGDKIDPDEIGEIRRGIPELKAATFLPRKSSIRQCAKRVNHSGNYCIGYKHFALQYEMEESESKKLVDLYSGKAYPGLRKWWKGVDNEITKSRTLRNCFGRTVYFMGQLGHELFKEGYAFVPQSTVFDIAGNGMQKMLDDDSEDFKPAHLAAQVHDNLLTDYRSRDFKSMARFTIKLGLDYMSPTLDYGEPFKLGVTVKAGRNWGDGSVEMAITPDEGEMARKLEEAWEKTHLQAA